MLVVYDCNFCVFMLRWEVELVEFLEVYVLIGVVYVVVNNIKEIVLK